MYSVSSKMALKDALYGLAADIQVEDLNDLDYDIVVSLIRGRD